MLSGQQAETMKQGKEEEGAHGAPVAGETMIVLSKACQSSWFN
jgi:hypothetical protein